MPTRRPALQREQEQQRGSTAKNSVTHWHQLHAVDARREGAVRRHEHQEQHRLAGRRVALHLGAALAEDEHLAGGLEQVVRRQDRGTSAASSAGRWRPRRAARRRSATAARSTSDSALRVASWPHSVRRPVSAAGPGAGRLRLSRRARRASSRPGFGGSRRRSASPTPACGDWTALTLAPARYDPASPGRSGGRRHRRARDSAVSPSCVVAPVALSNAGPARPRYAPVGASATPAATAAFSNVSRPAASSAGLTMRVDRRQVRAPDLVAALDQDRRPGAARRVRSRCNWPVFTTRANHLVGERHDAPRRPERVVGAHVEIRRRRRARLPRRAGRSGRPRSGRWTGYSVVVHGLPRAAAQNPKRQRGASHVGSPS